MEEQELGQSLAHLIEPMVPGTVYEYEVLEYCSRCGRGVGILTVIHGEPGAHQIGEVSNFCTCPKLFEG